MRRTLQRAVCSALVSSLLWSCGASITEPKHTPVGRPEGNPSTVLLIVLDGLRVDHLKSHGYFLDTMPKLEAWSADCAVFDNALTASTATVPALASILTGEHPHEHGLASVKELGQSRLAQGCETLAERFAAAGYRTLGAVSLPQLSDDVSGLGQGFERLYAPGTHEDGTRTARQTFYQLRDYLVEALSSEAPVFCMVHLADARRREGAPGEVAGTFLKEHMAPHLTGHPYINAAVQRLGSDASDISDAVEALRKSLARARGTAERRAFQAALYDSQLRFADDYVDQLIELLRQSGRYEDAVIAVLGTRGELFEDQPQTNGANFPEQVVRVPLIMHFPDGWGAGHQSAVVQSLDCGATLADLLEWEGGFGSAGRSLLPVIVGEVAPLAALYCTSAGLEKYGVFDEELLVEQSSILGTAAYRRSDGMLLRKPSEEEAQRIAGLQVALAQFSAAKEWVVHHHGIEGRRLTIDWRLLRFYAHSSRLELAGVPVRELGGRSTRVTGRVEMPVGEHSLVVTAARRNLPMRLVLTLKGGDLDESTIFAGPTPLSLLPLPRLPQKGAPPWPSEAAGSGTPTREPIVDLVKGTGTWWELRVDAPDGGEVEAVIALYPPRRLDAKLEWMPRAELQVEPAAGRDDIIFVRGESPLRLQVRRSHDEELAISVAIDGVQVERRDMRSNGRVFATENSISLYVPDWLQGVTDALDDAESAGAPLPPGATRILRRGNGLSADERQGVEQEHLGFLRRLRDDE